MKFLFLSCLLSFISSTGQAQSDMLVLKKNGKPFQKIFPGTSVAFFAYGKLFSGLVDVIEKDSVYLLQYDIRPVPTFARFYRYDTIATYRLKANWKDIKGFSQSVDRKFNWSGSGGALLGGGTLITVFGLGTWIFSKPNTQYYASPYLVGAAAVLAGAGYMLMRSGSKNLMLGKKYELQYVNIK